MSRDKRVCADRRGGGSHVPVLNITYTYVGSSVAPSSIGRIVSGRDMFCWSAPASAAAKNRQWAIAHARNSAVFLARDMILEESLPTALFFQCCYSSLQPEIDIVGRFHMIVDSKMRLTEGAGRCVSSQWQLTAGGGVVFLSASAGTTLRAAGRARTGRQQAAAAGARRPAQLNTIGTLFLHLFSLRCLFGLSANVP